MLKKQIILAGVATTALLIGSSAYAQTDTSAPAATAQASQSEPTEVVVTGFRKSYADAVKSKRNNIEITDGVSSDGLGRFPDLNVGEALQRVPGVQINREAEGRNATINLRGMPGSYARTTLNGEAFAEPPALDSDSSGPLGAFNSDIFSAFVVEKSPMANAQSGGLSGNIDMQIAPALSRKDGGFAKASYEYNTLGDLGSPAFTVGYNKHLSSNFAMFGTVAYKREKFRRDTLRFNTYSRLEPTITGLSNADFASTYGQYYSADACSSGTFCQSLASALGMTQAAAEAAGYITSTTGSKGNSGAWADSAIRQYSRMNDGTLWTASAGMEWKPNDNTKVGLIGYYSDRDLPKTTQYFLIDAVWDGAGIMTPNGDPVQTSDGRWVYPEVTYTNYPAKSSTRLYSQHQQSKGLMANFDWHNDQWHITAVATKSQGSNSSTETELDLQTNSTTAGNGLTASLNTGLGDLDNFSYSVTPDQRNFLMEDWTTWSASDPENWYTTDKAYTLNISGSESFATNDVTSARFDAERYVSWGPITSIQGGVRLEQNRFKSTGFRNMAYGAQLDNLTADMLINSPTASSFMEGDANISTNWPAIDAEKFIAAVTPVAVYNGGGLTAVGFNIKYTDGAFANYNYTNQNDLTEAYIQAKFETAMNGRRIRGNFGVRYEDTQNKINTLDQVVNFASGDGVGSLDNFAVNSLTNKYHQWLPSAIFAADLTDDLVLRGAYYKTYVRPQARQYSPVSHFYQPILNGSMTTSTLSVYDATVTLGNNKLHPYLADSVDLSLEWYNRPNSVMSLAWFKKKITGRIVATSDPAILCPSDGGGWGYGALSWDGTYCTATELTTASSVTHVNASGAYNLDSPTYVDGIELNIQQNLDFLPGFWKNFGGNFNYAYTTSKSDAIAPFPGISKHAVNLIGYYETTKFGIRAVYNWRSAYDLNANGTYTGGARSVRARGQLDMSASYNLNDRVTISLDGYNLTNSLRYEYENDEAIVRNIDYDGRTYTLTVKTNF
ncbi:MAG: TonB-dependent receptor [Asticcacaulis sp.]|uniref:TonB-dependent receptor n=1 Tax=Asticcacaulis sp. TaxID=1872648 RepID=UPI0039E52864